MGIVFGYLALVCFCMLLAKWIARRCNLTNIDKCLIRIHRPVSLLLTVFCILHIVFVIPVLRNRSVLVNVSGVVAVIFMVVLIFFCHVLKQKDRRMKWHRILTILMALCIVWHMVVYFMDFGEYQRNIAGITFKNIGLSDIEDGTYVGEYDAGYIYAKVEVMIEEGKIVTIKLMEHRNEKGKAAEKVLNDIVATQKIDVDAVSGATNSSNVIKKAVEDAITKIPNSTAGVYADVENGYN